MNIILESGVKLFNRGVSKDIDQTISNVVRNLFCRHQMSITAVLMFSP